MSLARQRLIAIAIYPPASVCAKGPLDAFAAPPCDQSPNQENDDRANDRTDEACAFVGAIPSNRLAEIGSDERADDAEDGGQDKAGWLVAAGGDELGDDAGDKTDDD